MTATPRDAVPLALTERVRALKLRALRSYSHPNQEEQLILLRNELVRETEAIADELERVAGVLSEMAHHPYPGHPAGSLEILPEEVLAVANTLAREAP